MRRLLIPLLLVSAVIATMLAAGCGTKTNGIVSLSDYEQINKEMTMDEVEGLIGPPQRSHKTGTTKTPAIYWYYGKTEGDGLVRVAFENGKVISLTPYNQSLSPDE